MLSLFLGSGFSKWAANLPLARELFDFDILLRGPREEQRLERLKKLKSYWDYQNPSEYPEKFIAYAHEMYKKKDLNILLWYIVRRLSDPFLVADRWSPRLRTPMIDEKIVMELPGVRLARMFLQKCRPSSIVTTNYDMLVEYALGTKSFNYGIKSQVLEGRGVDSVPKWNQGPPVLSGDVPLIKLHGSVNRDLTSYCSEGRRGITGNALIVAPVHEKKPPVQLQNEWNLARECLMKSNKLVVFGFAFKEYDQAVLNLLREAGRKLDLVLLIDPTPKKDAASKLWPEARISTIPPPDADFKLVKEWSGFVATVFR
ncbi:MAG TPA: SIR2 family protein [Nitrososphaera sp.]